MPPNLIKFHGKSAFFTNYKLRHLQYSYPKLHEFHWKSYEPINLNKNERSVLPRIIAIYTPSPVMDLVNFSFETTCPRCSLRLSLNRSWKFHDQPISDRFLQPSLHGTKDGRINGIGLSLDPRRIRCCMHTWSFELIMITRA